MAKILLVEDDLILREALENLLVKKGHQVFSAQELQGGATLLDTEKPGLLIVDEKLAGQPSEALLRQARARSCAVIVLTERDDAVEAERFKALGAGAVVCKNKPLTVLMDAADFFLTGPESRNAPGQKAAKPKVLVADDEASVCKILSRYLTLWGYQPTVARDGVEALESVSRERPDLILLDVIMPRKSGYETLRELSAHYPGIPVVMITGHYDKELAARCVEAGAHDFIEKPLDFDALESTIKSKIAHRV